jgi:hypothetical protein
VLLLVVVCVMVVGCLAVSIVTVAADVVHDVLLCISPVCIYVQWYICTAAHSCSASCSAVYLCVAVMKAVNSRL